MATSERAFVCVIDANIVLNLYFQQEGSDKTRALFAWLHTGGTLFYVPDLLFAECTNAFANYARFGNYTAVEARNDMSKLMGLRLQVVPTAELAAEALEISLRLPVTGYDACYMALADRIKAPLITADEKLVRALAGQGYPVHSLATFDTPPAA